MEGAVVQIEGPVVDNVSVLPVHAPDLAGEGGKDHVSVTIPVHVKQQGRGRDGVLAKLGLPQPHNPKITTAYSTVTPITLASTAISNTELLKF